MKYKNWACEVPDLDPRGFRPVAGKMRLYGGDGGGGDGGAAEAASLGLDIGTPGTSTGPSQGNVVGSENQPGGWMTGSGTGLVSEGMNISMGLDKDTPAFGSYAGVSPTAANMATLEAIASALNTTVEAITGLAGRNEFGVRDPSQISTALVDYPTLAAALEKDPSLGQRDLTNSQTVNQAIASKNFSDFLDVAVPAAVGIIGSQIPGYGAISTIGRVGSGLMSGTMTPGQAITAGLSGLIGSKTGLPAGMVEAALSGNMGRAAGAGAVSGLGALANALTGNPYAGAIAAATLGPSLGKSVSEAVGGSSSRGGGLPGMLDQGLGTSNWGGLFGGASAPSTSTAPTGNASGDLGITQEVSPTRAAIEQAAREASIPAWDRQIVAGRYGPIMQYEYGA